MVIGPEVPLVVVWPTRSGRLASPASGPSRDAARIEGSKAFAKDVMAAAGCAPPSARRWTAQPPWTPRWTGSARPPGQRAWVVKDDGLAAGKSVVVTADRDTARAHAADLLESRTSGAAGVLPRRPRGIAVLSGRRHHRRAVTARPGFQAGG